jgi:hypothetical protein
MPQNKVLVVGHLIMKRGTSIEASQRLASMDVVKNGVYPVDIARKHRGFEPGAGPLFAS